MKMFTKEERSTFPYWFAHWCAFQMTALNLNVWRLKYLFHDAEKPWLKLVMPYSKLQRFHRIHNKHHVAWLEHKLEKDSSEKNTKRLLKKFDFYAVIIDWECCHYTKLQCPLNAYDERTRLLNDNFEEKFPLITKCCYEEFSNKLLEVTKELGIDHHTT